MAMFSSLQTANRRTQRSALAMSAGVHGLFLVWLLHSPVPKFLKPSFVVRGGNGTLVAPLWPSSKFGRDAAPQTEKQRLSLPQRPLIWNSEKMRRAARTQVLQAHTTADLQTNLSDSHIQLPTAGSPHGTVLEGPLSGDEVRPALPIVSSDPLVDASELPDGLKEGDVVVEITIDAQGNIVQKNVISSLGAAIDSKVLAALENWRFLPATHWGNPIPSKQDVHYHFPRTPAS
jgi:TonB family protein